VPFGTRQAVTYGKSLDFGAVPSIAWCHAQEARKRAPSLPLSLLKNLSDLGIGLPMKIATDDFLICRIEHLSLLRPGHQAWGGAIASERYSCKKERPPYAETGPPVRSPQ
jgi:hypothetical protein